VPTSVDYRVKIDEETEVGHLSDAIYYPPHEVAGMTEEQILAYAAPLVRTRCDNYVAFVKEQSSKPPVKPTKEELEARKVSSWSVYEIA
jgi:hypothetical protein